MRKIPRELGKGECTCPPNLNPVILAIKEYMYQHFNSNAKPSK